MPKNPISLFLSLVSHPIKYAARITIAPASLTEDFPGINKNSTTNTPYIVMLATFSAKKNTHIFLFFFYYSKVAHFLLPELFRQVIKLEWPYIVMLTTSMKNRLDTIMRYWYRFKNLNDKHNLHCNASNLNEHTVILSQPTTLLQIHCISKNHCSFPSYPLKY